MASNSILGNSVQEVVCCLCIQEFNIHRLSRNDENVALCPNCKTATFIIKLQEHPRIETGSVDPEKSCPKCSGEMIDKSTGSDWNEGLGKTGGQKPRWTCLEPKCSGAIWETPYSPGFAGARHTHNGFGPDDPHWDGNICD